MPSKRHYRPWPDTHPMHDQPPMRHTADDKPGLRMAAGLVAWVACILLGLALLAIVLISAGRA